MRLIVIIIVDNLSTRTIRRPGLGYCAHFDANVKCCSVKIGERRVYRDLGSQVVLKLGGQAHLVDELEGEFLVNLNKSAFILAGKVT